MAWTWRFEKADGTEVTPAVRAEEFPTQGDAESWIGEEWKELLEGGADQASLFEDDTKVYGPMSLHAEQATPEGEPAEPADAAEDAEGAQDAERD
ncbi:hypothetical protein [Streptomyces sp. NBC_01497]|uniref:hypothetical protein n=1 Tax=Streptomyces sp. NBC_01497 TaxID=2903885 RepID=UPI002E30CDC9|nr:hypothetical protein [Streptomyces sp. NBC_01497]